MTVTLEEIEKLAEEFSAELDEDSLADVAGGYVKLPNPSTLKKIWKYIAKVLTC